MKKVSVKLVFRILFLTISIISCLFILYGNNLKKNSQSIVYSLADTRENTSGKGTDYLLGINYNGKRHVVHVSEKEYSSALNGDKPKLYYGEVLKVVVSSNEISKSGRVLFVFLLLFIFTFTPKRFYS